MSNPNQEEMLQRHRKEAKDLQATITSLKKQATKKTRKNVVNKCNDMERDLKEKQALEIQELKSGGGHEQNAESDNKFVGGGDEDISAASTPEALLAALELENKNLDVGTTSVENINNGKGQPLEGSVAAAVVTGRPKRNRQKERLAKRQQEIDRIKEEARLEALEVPDYKKLEEEGMTEMINLNGLELIEIKPDGNCLFSSIQDQLSEKHDIELLVEELRRQAATYIRENKDIFAAFMYNEATDELEDIDEYTTKLESTSMWGSDKEILAFTNIFECTISVLSFDTHTKRTNTLLINEGQQSNPQLNLAYYKHCYGLGEHYNSLRNK